MPTMKPVLSVAVVLSVDIASNLAIWDILKMLKLAPNVPKPKPKPHAIATKTLSTPAPTLQDPPLEIALTAPTTITHCILASAKRNALLIPDRAYANAANKSSLTIALALLLPAQPTAIAPSVPTANTASILATRAIKNLAIPAFASQMLAPDIT